MYSTSAGKFIETYGDMIERKQRTGNAPEIPRDRNIKAPRMKKGITCEYCGSSLWVGKHPKPHKCPCCRHLFFPCDRCDITCDKTLCKYDDGIYYEEAVWVRTKE